MSEGILFVTCVTGVGDWGWGCVSLMNVVGGRVKLANEVTYKRYVYCLVREGKGRGRG